MEQVPIFGTVEAAVKFWTFILGLWAICAVVNVALADLKGRNPYMWGLIGLFFGPLGVVAMLWRVAIKKLPEPKTEPEVLKNKEA
ncbi:hypothetical protein KAR34_04285 [bacterium]|nr:hypothetical protein [bacterium]